MNAYTDETVSVVLRAFGAYLAAGDRPLTRNQRADVNAASGALSTRTPEMTTEVIERALRARDDELDRGLRIVETAKAAKRSLSEAEEAELAAIKDHAEETNARIQSMDQLEYDKAAAAEYRRPYEHLLSRESGSRTYGGREHVYRPDGAHSFFADVYASSRGDGAAIERLTRNEKFASETRSAAGGEYRAGTTGSTSFGAFIPPTWLLDEIANKARAGRVVPDLIGSSGPPTSNSMVVPRVTTGTLTAIQATENTDLGAVDFVTLSLTRPTSTIGGYVDVSLQSLELGDFATDRMIFGDLIADYNRAVDSQCIIGLGTSAQLLGLDALTGLNVQTWTQASPTVPLFYSQVAQAISSVWTGRFDAPDAILMARAAGPGSSPRRTRLAGRLSSRMAPEPISRARRTTSVSAGWGRCRTCPSTPARTCRPRSTRRRTRFTSRSSPTCSSTRASHERRCSVMWGVPRPQPALEFTATSICSLEGIRPP